MSKLTRQTLKVFAASSANNGQFGSALVGTKVLTNNIATLQALSAWDVGWTDALISPETLPPYEESQTLDYVETYSIAYQFQEGIAEYDSGTTYFQNSIVKQPGTYNLYGSVTDNNTGNVLTDITNWTFLRNLQADIAVTMGFEASPSGRRLVFNSQTIAKTSGGTVNGSQYIRAYEYLWNNISDTYAPVSGGRGLSADADFAANKTITIPDFTNMSPMQVGTIVNSAGRNNIGASTVTSTGSVGGSITINSFTLSSGQLAPHSHLNGIADNGTAMFVYGGTTSGMPGSATECITNEATAVTFQGNTSTTGSGSSITPTGSLSATYTGNATSVVHPVFGVYYYINY